MEPIRARYVGYVRDTENHGDEALVGIIRDLLAPEIEVMSDRNRPYHMALLGGGTLINQSPWLIDFFRDALDRSQSGKGIVFGTGVGDSAFWGNHFPQWLPLLQRCEAVGVRGPQSLKLLQQHGFESAQCIGDPYLSIEPPIRPAPQSRRIGINLGSSNNSLWGKDDADFLEFMTGILRKLREDGFTFLWFSVWSKDLPLLEKIRDIVAPESDPVLDARAQTQKTYDALAECEICIGEKLHACAMAAVCQVPFIAMEYQPKVRDFAASMDMEPWVISTAERDAMSVFSAIRDLREQRSLARLRMARSVNFFRERISQFAMAAKSMAGRSLWSARDSPEGFPQ